MLRRLLFLGLAALWLPSAPAGSAHAQELTDLPAATGSSTAGTSAAEAARWEVLDYQPQLAEAAATTAELDRILSRDEFRDKADSPAQTENLWTKFLNWLSQLLGKTGIAPGTLAWPGVVAVVVAVLLIGYGLIRLLWSLQTRRRRSQGTAGTDGDPGLLSAAGLLRLADDAARRDDYRTAVRYRYLALLKLIEMPDAPRRTNSQVRHWLNRRHPAAGSPFSQLVGRFEDAWYGGLPCGPAEYELAAGHAGAVTDLLAAATADAAKEQRDARP